MKWNLLIKCHSTIITRIDMVIHDIPFRSKHQEIEQYKWTRILIIWTRIWRKNKINKREYFEQIVISFKLKNESEGMPDIEADITKSQ